MNFILREGKLCLLFAGWDYGEDWSGEFVRETHPFILTGEGCVQVTESERMAGRGAQDPRELIVPEIRHNRCGSKCTEWKHEQWRSGVSLIPDSSV